VKLPLSALLLLMAALLGFGGRALTADLGSGARVFKAMCAECHPDGGNVKNPAKNLSWDALEKNGKASLEAIKLQVTNGKDPMPSFKPYLNQDQIEDVAAYVLERAKNGW
jgi:cytochrome c6